MLHHAGSPDLHTRRLRLRAYRLEDDQQMFDNWAGDPEVTRFLNWGPHADVGITYNTYIHVIKEQKAKAVASLPNFISGKPSACTAAKEPDAEYNITSENQSVEDEIIYERLVKAVGSLPSVISWTSSTQAEPEVSEADCILSSEADEIVYEIS